MKTPRTELARALCAVAATTLLIPLLAGCGADDVPSRPSASTGEAADRLGELAEADLWLSFEDIRTESDGATDYLDAVGGDVAARVVTAEGGVVLDVEGADGGGSAVEFPARCDDVLCPRAMLEIAADPALDPEEQEFSFGAAVWLAPDQTATGSNIVQKGRFATDGGQWKLQVDDEEGRPSCVVRSGTTVLRVRANVSISDSTWHRVECVRDARGIGIVVDGEERRAAGETGSVTNEWPIRIGSPGVGVGDDQFHGRIDDVFLHIAPDA